MQFTKEDVDKVDAIFKRVRSGGKPMDQDENALVNAYALHQKLSKQKSVDDFTGDLSKTIGAPNTLNVDGLPGGDGTLSGAIKAAEFDRKSKNVVEVPFAAATGFKTATIDGGTDVEDVSPTLVGQPPLGADERYLFPSLNRSPIN